MTSASIDEQNENASKANKFSLGKVSHFFSSLFKRHTRQPFGLVPFSSGNLFLAKRRKVNFFFDSENAPFRLFFPFGGVEVEQTNLSGAMGGGLSIPADVSTKAIVTSTLKDEYERLKERYYISTYCQLFL